MITLFLIWLLIAVYSYILGSFFATIVFKFTKYTINDVFSRLLIGFGTLITYAQIFSIFYKVGIIAQVVLLFSCILIVFLNKKNTVFTVRPIIPCNTIQKISMVFVTIAVAYLSAKQPLYYDTDLYHAQAIQWIEEYGIVTGLGNLYNRMAYNSSMFCISALFSFVDILGQSVRPINGYIAVLFGYYAIATFNKSPHKNFTISNLINLATLSYLCLNILALSSPNSDTIAIVFVLILVSKWFDLLETGNKNIIPYTIICIGFVIATTLKLSVAFLLIFALYPAIVLLKTKKWNIIIFFVIVGLISLLPYLIRNIILSGYILYPYPMIDLFNVDWKMPYSIVNYDYEEIKVWGRSLNDVNKYDYSIVEWFPTWFSGIGIFYQITFVSAAICNVALIFHGFIKCIRKKISPVFYFSCIVPILVSLLWLLSSPLIRYGGAFLLLNISIYIYYFLLNFTNNRCKKFFAIFIGAYAVLCFYLLSLNKWDKLSDELNTIMQEDYKQYEVDYEYIADIPVYYSLEGDLIGYHKFPAVPYKRRIPLLELREDTMADGFRFKEEYNNENLLDLYR